MEFIVRQYRSRFRDIFSVGLYLKLPVSACCTKSPRHSVPVLISNLEWHLVTVASFQTSKSAIGLPTILLLPKTTALAPLICTSERLMRSRQPSGVQGTMQSTSPRAVEKVMKFRLLRQLLMKAQLWFDENAEECLGNMVESRQRDNSCSCVQDIKTSSELVHLVSQH